MTKNINNILNIGFIGFGLIAGSMAKAIKNAHPEYIITATSRSLSSVYDAQKDGVIDIVCENINSSFSECDFIFLCTPVVTIIDYLEQLKPVKKNGCIKNKYDRLFYRRTSYGRLRAFRIYQFKG